MNYNWISVDDELPKVSKNAKDFQLMSGESDPVLIWMDGYKIATYHESINTWSIPFHSGKWKPTHWAILLDPPKAE